MSDDSSHNQTPKRGRSKQGPGMTDEQKAILAQVPDLYNDPRSLVEIWADGFKQRSEQLEMQQQQQQQRQHVQQQQYIQQQQPSAQQTPFLSPSRPRPYAAAPVFTALGAATPGQQGGEDPFVQRNSPAAAATAATAGARNTTTGYGQSYGQGYHHHHKRGSGSSSSLGTTQWPTVVSPLSERVTPPSRASYAPPAQFGSPSPAPRRVSFARIEEEEEEEEEEDVVARQVEQRREKKKKEDGQGWR